MPGIGLTILAFLLLFWLCVRKYATGSYIFMALIAIMGLPSIFNIQDILAYDYPLHVVPIWTTGLLTLLLLLSAIPWVITDKAFCKVGFTFTVNRNKIKSLHICLIVLIILSLYSIIYLMPFAVKSVLTGAAVMRFEVFQTSILPHSPFTTLATGSAACFMYCMAGFFLADICDEIRKFKWWLLFASLSYPVNGLVYVSRDALVIYLIMFMAMYILFHRMTTLPGRNSMRHVMYVMVAVTGIAVIGISLQRFAPWLNSHPPVSQTAGTLGYIAQQPYVFGEILTDNDITYDGLSRTFPVLNSLFPNLAQPRQWIWDYHTMFGTMFGSFFLIGGWKPLLIISTLYFTTTWGGAFYLYKKNRYNSLLLFFIPYLFLEISGLFYFKAGNSALFNLFYISTLIIPFLAPDWFVKKPTSQPSLLCINTVAQGASTARVMMPTIRAARDAGWDCSVMFARRGVPKPTAENAGIRFFQVGSRLSLYYHLLRTRLLDRHGSGSKKATRQICRYLREERPDLVVLHNIHGYFLNYKILFRELKNLEIPIIWTFHDLWPITGHCAHFDNIGCNLWEFGCNTPSCPNIKSYPASRVSNCKKNFSDKKDSFSSLPNLRIAAVSSYLKKRIARSFMGAYPAIVIHNGINTDIFHPMSEQESDAVLPKTISDISLGRKVVFAAASPWRKEKGLDVLPDMAERLTGKAILLVAGVSAKQARFLKRASNNIITLPKIHNLHTMAALYCRADVFWNPSSADSLPFVNLEAQACGTPVVSADSGGCVETICPGISRTYRSGNMDEALRCITDILDSKRSVCHKLYNWVSSEFSITDQNTAYLSLFKNATGKN